MEMTLKKRMNTLRLMLPLLLLILLTASEGSAKANCLEAMLLCGRLIIPSLFPFFVLSAFLTRLGLPQLLGGLVAPLACRAYGISPAGASALVMGFIGGYPAGAAYIADMEKGGLIGSAEGERLIAFCNNSGPAFIVGVMGSAVFGSVSTGLRLYAVHIFSALVTGLFFRDKPGKYAAQDHKLDETDTAEALVASVKQAVGSILNVCGFVICFSLLVSMLDTAGFFSLLCGQLSALTGLELHFIKAAFTGVLELGSGAGAMQGLPASPLNLALAAGMLSWGGLSVHFQTMAVLSGSKIKGTLHLTGRLISAVTAFIAMLLLSVI